MTFENKPFKSLLKAIVDNRGKTCPVEEQGLPLIATNCVTNDTLYPALKTDRFVSKSTYETWFRGHPLPDDILFTCKGTPGRVNLVPPDVGFCIAQDMVAIRADEKQVTSHYLFAVLRSRQIQSAISNLHVGNTVPHFKKGDFDKLDIPVPDLETQTVIGGMYFSLSKYIDELSRQNTTLEAIAQTLFRSWFLNFDPVHAKAAGQTPEGMSPELAALFPSEFVESELGMIPKGWAKCGLVHFAHLNANSWTKASHPERISYLDLSSVKQNNLEPPTLYSFTEAPSRARRVLRKGDSIFGTVRPGNLSYGFVSSEDKSLTGSTGFAVLTPKRDELRAFVYCCMTEPSNIERLTHQADGAAYPAVNPSVVLEQEVVVPATQELLTWFGKVCNPLFEQIGANRDLIKNLTCLRDELLPRLISGKLRIEEAEEAVSEVLGVLTAEEKAA